MTWRKEYAAARVWWRPIEAAWNRVRGPTEKRLRNSIILYVGLTVEERVDSPIGTIVDRAVIRD